MIRQFGHHSLALAQLLGGDVLSKALLVVANILLIRAMPASEFAIFTTMFALVQFSYQSVCGVIERLYIAEHQKFLGAEKPTLFILLACSSVLVFVYFAMQSEWIAAGLTVVSGYAFGFFQLTRIRLQKEERYRRYVLMDVARNAMSLLLLVIVFVSIRLPSHQALVAVAVFALCAAVAELIGRERAFKDAVRKSYAAAARILLARTSLIAYALAGAIFPYVPIILADKLCDAQVVASYGVAQRYQSIVSMLAVATNVYMLPRLANFATHNDAAREAAKLFRSTLFIALMVAAYIVLVWVFMPILNGPNYDDARPMFVLLAVCGTLSLVSTSMVNLLLRREQYAFLLASILAGLVCNVVFGIGALPIFGPLSFALGALLGYAITNVSFVLRGAWIVRRAHTSDHI